MHRCFDVFNCRVTHCFHDLQWKKYWSSGHIHAWWQAWGVGGVCHICSCEHLSLQGGQVWPHYVSYPPPAAISSVLYCRRRPPWPRARRAISHRRQVVLNNSSCLAASPPSDVYPPCRHRATCPTAPAPDGVCVCEARGHTMATQVNAHSRYLHYNLMLPSKWQLVVVVWRTALQLLIQLPREQYVYMHFASIVNLWFVLQKVVAAWCLITRRLYGD